MTKLLFVGDVHISDRPPLGRREGYREQILDKLYEVGQIANDREVDAVVFLGDIFHSKRPMFNSHYLVQRMQEVLDRCRCPVYIVPGNHDMGEDGLESLARQPLGVLKKPGHVIVMPYGHAYEGAWDVNLISRPYHSQRDLDPEYYRPTPQELDPKKVNILVAHGSILDGTTEAYECLQSEDMARAGIFKDIHIVVSGHIHEPMGPVELTGGTSFVNPGALARPTRKEPHMSRRVQVLEVITEVRDKGRVKTWDCKFHPIQSMLPAEEVFLEREQNRVVVTDEIAHFADSLAAGLQAEDAPIEALLAGLEGVPDEVKREVQKFLEAVGV